MTIEEFKESKCYKYALDVVGRTFPTSKYIKKICKNFIHEIDNQDKIEYFFDLREAKRIMSIMKLINFATGSVAGKSLYEVCVDYQYFLILNMFCWKRKDNHDKRRYEVVILWIARKNSKSVNAGLMMIILMLIEPKYSEFYLCSNTREQAKIVYGETRKLIECSPAIKSRFDIKRDVITCKLNENTLKALSSDFNTTDGLRVSAACIDEVGAAKDGGLIESMTSGMLSVQNRMLILISTSYPNITNPFLEWTDYAKKVIDGVEYDPKLFAMLYSLDEGDEMTTDNFLKANPLQASLQDGIEYLESEYKKALSMGGAKLTSFKTKHLNIWLEAEIGETYIPIEAVKKCVKTDKDDFNWTGLEVYLGIDLAMTTDNCSVSMVAEVNDIVYAMSIAFIPESRIGEKSRMEKIDYQREIDVGTCIACGDSIVDYAVIEKYIMSIQRKYKVKVMGIGFDRYNCISTAQKLENEGYETIEIKQHSSVLHSPTKLLEELILSEMFRYDANKLLEINFSNAKCVYDTNLNRYVNKRKSNGKIDMVASLINALCLLEKHLMQDRFAVQVF